MKAGAVPPNFQAIACVSAGQEHGYLSAKDLGDVVDDCIHDRVEAACRGQVAAELVQDGCLTGPTLCRGSLKPEARGQAADQHTDDEQGRGRSTGIRCRRRPA